MSDSAAEAIPALRPVEHGADWLPASELAALTPAKLIARMTNLQPLLAEHAMEAERLRRPVDLVWNAIRRSGAFYQFVPKKYGGLEFRLADFFEAMLPLGAGCASTAWVTTFCVEHNWLLTQFSEEAQDEIFGRFPYIIAPGATAPPGKLTLAPGGYRLSGRWRWGTGVMHADWALLMAMTADSPPSVGFCVLPIADVVVPDTWRMDGMIGTGSHDLLVEDAFVPAHRFANFDDVRRGRGNASRLYDNPIYRMPMLPFLALTAAIPALGAARGAVDRYREQMQARLVYGTDTKHADRPVAQMHLARAELAVDAAELVLRDVVRTIEALARADEAPVVADRLRLRAKIAYAVDLCRGAVGGVCAAAGSSAHQLENPLQRAFRDINTMATHIVFDMDAATEGLGRAMLGLPPNSPLI